MTLPLPPPTLADLTDILRRTNDANDLGPNMRLLVKELIESFKMEIAYRILKAWEKDNEQTDNR